MWSKPRRSSPEIHPRNHSLQVRPSHVLIAATALLLLQPHAASATPELPTHYDARSLGMGGTGVSYTDNAAAAATNPAGLARIESFALTVVIAPFMPRPTAPFTDGQSMEGERSQVPLPFVGAAYRLSDDLVMGAAVYAASGAGAEFAPIAELDGLSIDLAVAIMEAAVPVAFAINDRLSVGAALRFGFAFVQMDVPTEVAPALPPARVDTSFTGVGFPGALIGAQYRPTDRLSLGIAYRSKLTVDMEGDGKITADFLGGVQPVQAATTWSVAHALRLGADLDLQPLTLALDVSYTLLDDAIDSLPLRFALDDGSVIEPEVPLNWNDSLAAFFGAEWALDDQVALRAGYGIIESGTPERFADPRMPPPGLMQSFSIGGGYAPGAFRLDLGATYIFAGSDVESTPNGRAGTYESDVFLLSSSLSYVP